LSTLSSRPYLANKLRADGGLEEVYRRETITEASDGGLQIGERDIPEEIDDICATLEALQEKTEYSEVEAALSAAVGHVWRASIVEQGVPNIGVVEFDSGLRIHRLAWLARVRITGSSIRHKSGSGRRCDRELDSTSVRSEPRRRETGPFVDPRDGVEYTDQSQLLFYRRYSEQKVFIPCISTLNWPTEPPLTYHSPRPLIPHHRFSSRHGQSDAAANYASM
jgi:hypothetical protein